MSLLKNNFVLFLMVLSVLTFSFWPDKKVPKTFQVEQQKEESLKTDHLPEIEYKIPEKEIRDLGEGITNQTEKIANSDTTEKKKPHSPPSLLKKIPKDYIPFKIKEGFAVSQGDILLGKVKDPNAKIELGAFKPSQPKLWPSHVIPYSIDGETPNAEEILRAISYFNENTPLEFVPLKKETDSIVFTPAQDLCSSYLGHMGGHQPIYISPRCGFTEILHEIMHALGFVHEHSRLDRDKYISILWDHIEEDFYTQFMIIPDSLIHHYSGSVFDFDYESIMLYPPTAFAKNPRNPSIKSLTNQKVDPKREQLSRIDHERLFYLYGY